MSGDPPMELYVEGLTRSALSQKLQFAAACGLRVAAPLASSCRGKRETSPRETSPPSASPARDAYLSAPSTARRPESRVPSTKCSSQ
jgi:hypothetical protein